MDNPYSPPAGGIGAAPAGPYASDSRASPSETTMEMLRQTRPWVVFLSVMAFIGAGFMVLGGLASIGLGLAGGREAAPMAMLGFIYLPMAALYVYPAIKLWAYGGAINRLVASRSVEDLEAALLHQKSFWKYAGITTVVMIVLYVLVIVGGVIAGIVGAATMR